MSMHTYLPNPTSTNINLSYGIFPITVGFKDASGSSLHIFFHTQAEWDKFSETVHIFDLSLQPVELAA